MLLREIEKYLGSTGMAPTRFGKESVGDPCFVFELRNGREPRGTTARRVLRFIKAQGETN
jgi:hypothetical protein